jgi:hypothetical protein
MSVGSVCVCPNSSYRFLSQQASLPASDRATYSASVVDNAIVVCFLDLQVIAPPLDKKMYPDVDLQSSVSAYEASLYPWKRLARGDGFGTLGVLWYVIPYSLVPM